MTMYSRPQRALTTRFGRITGTRSDTPLSDEVIKHYAPSIFADEAHESRSDRYTYIPTSFVLNKLRQEGFFPFMVCQTRTRKEDMREHTKHMIRLRHANQINGEQANEIILINSHNGTSSYQMKAGMYRFVCQNGLVMGEDIADLRVPHKGDVADFVIEGAYEVLESFKRADEGREAMQALTLNSHEQHALATAALELRYNTAEGPAPVTARDILTPRRYADDKNDLWTSFNRVQENLIKGGQSGRNKKGKRTTTRAITGMDQDVKLNRALWVLSNELRRQIAA